MGVLGLTPFLARHCPDVLKELPNGIKAISGKTIVIDATLLTQRFHFGRGVHNRHVSGWYRLITNLKASDVNTICVFDGKERNLAKAGELQRRRETRATSVARENLEVERLERLGSLQKLVRKVRSLPAKQRGAIADELRPFVKVKTPLPPPTLPPDTKERDCGPEVEQEDHEQPVAVSEEALSSEKPPVPEYSQTSGSTKPSSPIPESPREQASRKPVPEPDTPIKKLATKLVNSYKRYSDSLPNFAKLQIAVSTIPLTSSSTQNREPIDPDPEFYAAASRHQYQLALQEGQAWSKLVEEQPDAVRNAEDEFQDLQERSQILTDTYQRRNEFPTAQTYEDAKSLLVAMGIPCVESEAPYEGEGLASAIVLAGHADFVVSEDTDVVVYGAPLLRHVTSDSKRPIMEIDSREVLKALSLSRESFVDFALLAGTDFTPRLKNVGPVRALKFIREHGSIEEIVKTETSYPPQLDLPEYLEKVKLGREIFRCLPPVPSPDKLQQLPVDEAGIQAVVGMFGLSLADEEEDFFTVALKGNYFGDSPHHD